MLRHWQIRTCWWIYLCILYIYCGGQLTSDCQVVDRFKNKFWAAPICWNHRWFSSKCLVLFFLFGRFDPIEKTYYSQKEHVQPNVLLFFWVQTSQQKIFETLSPFPSLQSQQWSCGCFGHLRKIKTQTFVLSNCIQAKNNPWISV